MRLTHLEIVSHCWAVKHPHFAACLNYQLSSLLGSTRHCKVTATVCCEASDERTERVIRFFIRQMPMRIIVQPTVGELGRRSIGRNIAAKGTEADVVWFADVDYVFGDGCLDALATGDWRGMDLFNLFYPRSVQISADHATGDRQINRAMGDPRLVFLNMERENEWQTHVYRRAIGGVQIVRGDLARRHGYLDGEEKWQRPAGTPFGDTREDRVYRSFCGQYGSSMGLDLPNLYRLRHSEGHPR